MSLQDVIVKSKRAELLSVAHSVLDGTIHPIDGVRKICALRDAVGFPEHEVFMPLRAIESETDRFLLNQARDGCAADYLKKVDAEMNRYLSSAKEDILAGCRSIILLLSSESEKREA